jgi:DtxR family Mn-dependent transcriptional regulator
MEHTSPAVEDYLKAIYELSRTSDATGAAVSTTALAEAMAVSPASATGMVKRLAADGHVAHRPYEGVRLTDAGRRIALETIRHHRLVETYLFRELGVPWERLHAEAERWEHVLSEDLEARMDAALGHPAFDPHGAPIPTPDLEVAERRLRPLAELGAGTRTTVTEVSDRDAERLQRFAAWGLRPGATVEVLAAGDPLRLRVGDAEHEVPAEAARHVFVP